MEHEKRQKTTSCGALVWRTVDGTAQVLLIKQFRHKDTWGIPKGHLNEGETLEQCALREVKEETGVSVSLGVALQQVRIKLRNEDKTVVSWLATPVGDPEPRCDHEDSEVADVAWFPVDALPQITQYQKQLIEEGIVKVKFISGVNK